MLKGDLLSINDITINQWRCYCALWAGVLLQSPLLLSINLRALFLLSIESIPFVVARRYGLTFCFAITINRLVAGREDVHCCQKGTIRSLLLEGLLAIDKKITKLLLVGTI